MRFSLNLQTQLMEQPLAFLKAIFRTSDNSSETLNVVQEWKLFVFSFSKLFCQCLSGIV